MELKDSKRVVETIELRLNEVIQKDYPFAAKMVPREIKELIKNALAGAYASGFNHGMIEAKNGESK